MALFRKTKRTAIKPMQDCTGIFIGTVYCFLYCCSFKHRNQDQKNC